MYMNEHLEEPEFNYILNVLKHEAEKRPKLQPVAREVAACIAKSSLEPVIKHTYMLDDAKWLVYHGQAFKMTLDAAHTYHCFFDKQTGFNLRFGSALDEDPDMCMLGPEIADIEVVTGSCPKVSSENCRWCYKNNTSAPGKRMTLEQFKTVVESFPENLSQVALGITGVKSNPDLRGMLDFLASKGIAGNLTLTGADMDDEACDMLASRCGAVAVSCYDKAKELCYETIQRLHESAAKKFKRHMSVNMHIVIADFSMPHVMSVLQDVKDGKVPGLSSVVMLHAKPVGRAEKLDCSLSKANLRKAIELCLGNSISFGFDSCNGHNVLDTLKELGREDLCSAIQPCESARESIYVNVEGKVTPCSFVEHVYESSAIDLLTNNVRLWDIWRKDSMLEGFRKCSRCSKSCPAYELDCK